jgi:hypothetical protein
MGLQSYSTSSPALAKHPNPPITLQPTYVTKTCQEQGEHRRVEGQVGSEVEGKVEGKVEGQAFIKSEQEGILQHFSHRDLSCLLKPGLLLYASP